MEAASHARHISNWIQGYLEFTDNTEPPEIFREWVGISTIASVLQRKCYLTWSDDLIFYPNLYIVLVAPPASARKTTAMISGLKFLREPGINVRLAAEAITREALIREINNARDFYEDEDNRMVTHSSLTVYSAELAVFLGYNNPAMLSDLCDWYDCRDQWKYQTKGAGTSDYIDNVWVNILGGTTPELIQSTIPVGAIGNGLASRMVFVYANKKGKVIPTPFTTDDERQLRKLLVEDLVNISSLKGQFKFTEKFIGAWTEFYTTTNEVHPFRDDKFLGYFDRRAATILKLCMVLVAARSNEMVLRESDLILAIDTLSKVERTMQRALQGLGRNPFSDILHKVMYEIASKKEVSMADLMAKFISDLNYSELEDIIRSLDMAKYVVFVENTGKVRATLAGEKLDGELD